MVCIDELFVCLRNAIIDCKPALTKGYATQRQSGTEHVSKLSLPCIVALVTTGLGTLLKSGTVCLNGLETAILDTMGNHPALDPAVWQEAKQPRGGPKATPRHQVFHGDRI